MRRERTTSAHQRARSGARARPQVRVDQVYDNAIRVNFNLTTLSMPCAYVSVDISDVMGASVLNVSSGIHRERVLANGERARYSVRKPLKSSQSRLSAARSRHRAAPNATVRTLEGDPEAHCVRLTTANFTAFVDEVQGRALVLFGAAWCRWTRDMLPDWAAATREVRRLGLDGRVRLGVIDCSRADSAATCARHYIAAFPAVHLYEKGARGLHQNYVGPRDADSLVSFARRVAEWGTFTQGLATPLHANLARGNSGREGCALAGSVFVSRVPGSLRIAAHADGLSFNPRWINMGHTVHAFSFGVPDRRERLRHAQQIAAITEAQRKLAARLGRASDGDGVIETGEVRRRARARCAAARVVRPPAKRRARARARPSAGAALAALPGPFRAH